MHIESNLFISFLNFREFINLCNPRLTGLICMISLVLIGYLGSYISKFFPHMVPTKEKEALKDQAISSLWGGYCIILGFIMVNGWDSFVDAQKNVINETSALNNITQQIIAYPEQNQKEILQAIQHYINATNKEWKTMRHGKSSAEAKKALNELNKTLIHAFPNDKTSVVSFQINDAMAQLNTGRFLRIDRLESFIPDFLKGMLLSSVSVLMFITGFLTTEKKLVDILFIISFAMLAGFLLGLCLSFDYPFSGTFSVLNSFSELSIKDL